MKSELVIREMTINDISDFIRIRNECKEYLHDNSEFSVEQATSWFIKTTPKFYIIEYENKTIGYFRTSNWEKDKLYIGCDIDVEYRGKGLAYESYLLFIEKLKKEYHIKKIQLEVLSNNQRAINLYNKLGFKQIGVTDNKIIRNENTLESIVMELKLSYEVEKLKVIIPTCDKYIHIVEALMYSLNKYWSSKNEFIILGYSKPNFELYDNWKFVSMGTDTGANNWSNDLLNFFNTFEDDYFINMIDDTLMTRPADIYKIEKVFNYMLRNKDVKKCFLQGSLSIGGKDLLGEIDYYPIEELDNTFCDVSQTANYRTSIQSAIWSTEYFLQVLKPNLTPWDFELQHLKNDGVRILTTRSNHPIMFSHLCSKLSTELMPNWTKSMYEATELPMEDVRTILQILKK